MLLRQSRRLAAIAVPFATLLAVNPAYATPLTATLFATYYQVALGSDPDFQAVRGQFPDLGTPNVAVGSLLGPNGLPTATGPYGIVDVDPTTQEITWWGPSLNNHVSQTGTGTVTLPYSSSMFAPNSTGSDNFSEFETAVFTGYFALATASTVSFALGSDDDSFIYVDGVLIGQNPGIRSDSAVEFTSSTLSAGSHDVEIFYADRQRANATLSLSLISDDIAVTATPVPEPVSATLLFVGLAGIGAVRRRQVKPGADRRGCAAAAEAGLQRST
jgi:hypothetical protein